MGRVNAARVITLSTVLGFAVLAGCNDQPTQPNTVPEIAPRLGVSAGVESRIANIDPRYLGSSSYRYFFGHRAAGGSSSVVPDIEPDALKVFPNILVNDRTQPGLGQSETTVAQNGKNIVVGWNDAAGFQQGNFLDGLSGWGLSTDGGLTFVDGGGLPRQATANFQHIGDPDIKVSSAGTFFYTDLCVDGAISGVCVTKGTVSGATVAWGTPAYARTTTSDFLDKTFVAVSPSGLDVYMSYTRFINGGGNGQIEVVASHDGGTTWGVPVVLAAAGVLVNQGSEPAIGSGGELYVVWEQGIFNTNSPSIKLRKSTDGGVTYGSTVNVATIGSLANTPPVGYNRSTFNDFPRIAVALSGTGAGNVYVSFHSVVSGNANVFVARSTNGGTSFGAGVKMNDDVTTALQFWPTIAVDANGKVVSAWYDRRLNPGTALTDVYWAISTDGGLTFLANQRVTGVSTNWSNTNTDIIPNFGDYNGLAVRTAGTKSLTYAVWGDGRNGDPDVFFSRIGMK